MSTQEAITEKKRRKEKKMIQKKYRDTSRREIYIDNSIQLITHYNVTHLANVIVPA